jgi:hypothetical protein
MTKKTGQGFKDRFPPSSAPAFAFFENAALPATRTSIRWRLFPSVVRFRMQLLRQSRPPLFSTRVGWRMLHHRHEYRPHRLDPARRRRPPLMGFLRTKFRRAGKERSSPKPTPIRLALNSRIIVSYQIIIDLNVENLEVVWTVK